MTKRKSTAEKKLSGTSRPDREMSRGTGSGATSTRCPDGMPPAAQKIWRKLIPALAAAGRYVDSDQNAARDLCLTLVRLREAEALIDEKGLLVDGRGGGLVRNPATMLAQQYRQAFYRWCSKFGLTPVDRGALGPAVKPDEPSLSELLRTVVDGLDVSRNKGGEGDGR